MGDKQTKAQCKAAINDAPKTSMADALFDPKVFENEGGEELMPLPKNCVCSMPLTLFTCGNGIRVCRHCGVGWGSA